MIYGAVLIVSRHLFLPTKDLALMGVYLGR